MHSKVLNKPNKLKHNSRYHYLVLYRSFFLCAFKKVKFKQTVLQNITKKVQKHSGSISSNGHFQLVADKSLF